MGLVLVVPPTEEPLSVDVAKTHCKIDPDETSFDDILAIYVGAAREQVEAYAGIGMLPQTWKQTLARFPIDGSSIDLGRGPVRSIESITYLDSSGDRTALAADTYVLESTPISDKISLAFGKIWPTIRQQAGSIEITFSVGWDDATKVPKRLIVAMLFRTGDIYKNPEAHMSAPLTNNEELCAMVDQFIRDAIV